MLEFSETYLRKNFDRFQFFDHECTDKRIREVYMRTRRCLKCPGLSHCRMHPDFWLDGEADRAAEDRRIRESGEEVPPVIEEEFDEEPEEEEEEAE